MGRCSGCRVAKFSWQRGPAAGSPAAAVSFQSSSQAWLPPEERIEVSSSVCAEESRGKLASGGTEINLRRKDSGGLLPGVCAEELDWRGDASFAFPADTDAALVPSDNTTVGQLLSHTSGVSVIYCGSREFS